MVVDVVASRQRKYESGVVNRILPEYRRQSFNLGMDWLSKNEPSFLRLREGEATTMKEVALFLQTFATNEDDEQTIQNFVAESAKPATRLRAIAIKGIGPVLYEYLRLLSGADTIKIDTRVRDSLRALGVPQHFFSDQGLLELSMGIAQTLGCTLAELDQALWLREKGPKWLF
jgi:hypothetical protein